MENSKLRYLDADYSYYVRVEPEDNTITVDSRHKNDDAITFHDYHRHAVIIGLRGNVDADKIDEALESEEITALVQRISDGYTSKWDGNNNIGHYDTDAQAATEELTKIIEGRSDDGGDWHLEGENAGLWEASTWLDQVTPAEYGLTADTTDEELDAIVEKIENEAASDNVRLDGTEATLRRWRDELIEKAGELPHIFELGGQKYTLTGVAGDITRDDVKGDVTEPTYLQIADALHAGQTMIEDFELESYKLQAVTE